MGSLVWEDPLEEGMATHSSILAWRIPMDRGAWQAIAHGVTESDTTECLSTEITAKWVLLPRVCSPGCLCAKSLQLCSTVCDPVDCSPPDSSVHGDSPGKNTGMGCHALLQGIFPTQGSNPGLTHCKQILYHLSHQGSP